MSSTNKTTNYELSQFLGSDKPAWLTDYNSDMSKIDTGVHNAQSTATSADGKATANATAIGTLSNLTTDVKTDVVSAINEVDGHADTAQNTANNAVNAAGINATAIQALDAYLNLNDFTTPTVTATNATIDAGATSVQCAANSTGSLGKIYGSIRCTANSSTFTLTFPTPLRPSETITINGICPMYWSDDNNIWKPINGSVEIATDGTATINQTGAVNNRKYRISLIACVIFAKSFGDTPLPE